MFRTQAYNNNHRGELFGYFHIMSSKLKFKSISFLLRQGFPLLCNTFSLPAVFRIKGSAQEWDGNYKFDSVVQLHSLPLWGTHQLISRGLTVDLTVQ